ncbi:hypothetical protein [Spongiactinospora gelatinilytica]|uniref:hypothetical protein n=1 Tax=Spongiactinospora gelatinilytica TaxID=2666298 RepID=UPI0011B9488F|nr:hypothetical protein [Spongiactinospora gelatinilytica]
MRLSIRTGVVAGCLALSASLTPAAVAQAAEDTEVELPGTGVVLHEKSTDRLLVTAYMVGDDVYLRGKGGDAFAKKSGYTEITVSPGGARAAGLRDKYASSGYDQVAIIDRATGTAKYIRTVKKPFITAALYWSRDGRKILGTTQRKVGKKWLTHGFSVIDVAAGTHSEARLPKPLKDHSFEWSPDARSVYIVQEGKLLEYGLDGKPRRTLDVGVTASGDDVFSPSGKRLLTWCPKRYREPVCVAARGTGKVVKRLAVEPEHLWGWWDESHLMMVYKNDGAYRSVVTDLNGKTTRVLADITSSAWKNDDIYLSYTRR